MVHGVSTLALNDQHPEPQLQDCTVIGCYEIQLQVVLMRTYTP